MRVTNESMPSSDETLLSRTGYNLSQPAEGVNAESVPPDWNVGDTIMGLYRVEAILGEGGMGRVYKVLHRNWGTHLAVKSPREALLKNPKAVDRFVKECETWINLGLHPHVVSCYYVRRLGGIPRIFAECVTGTDLYAAMTKGHLYEGSPEKVLERLLSIAIQGAWGLHHAHQHNLVHRDVKPHNFMVNDEWTTKITDFGLAEAVTADMPDTERMRGGMTPAFASPEQLDHQVTTPATDIWSWAATILAMFCGKVKWKRGDKAPDGLVWLMENGPTVEGIPPMPKGLPEILGSCMQVDIAKRPRDLQLVANHLIKVYEAAIGASFPYKQPENVGAIASSLSNRAASLMDLGKQEEAIALWEDALRSDASLPQAVYNLGLTLWRIGRLPDDSLLDKISEGRRFAKDSSIPLFQMFNVHLERGDVSGAKALIEGAIKSQGAQPQFNQALERTERLLQNGRGLQLRVDAHADAVKAVWISLEGDRALTGSEDNTVRMWSIPDGECLQEFSGHAGSVDKVAATRDGRMVFSASQDRTFRLWDRSSGECVKSIPVPREATRACAMATDSPTVIARHTGNAIARWDLISGEISGTGEGHDDWINAIAISRDERIAVSAGQDGKIIVWNFETLEKIRELTGHDGAVTCIALNENGDYAVSGGADKSLRVWDIAAGKAIRLCRGHRESVTTVSVSGDGRFALSGSTDNSVRFWYLGAGRCLTTLEGHTESVNGVDLPQEGPYAVSCSHDQTLAIWKIGDRRQHYKASYMLCRMQRAETAVSTGTDFKKFLSKADEQQRAGHLGESVKALRRARELRGYERHSEGIEAWSRLYPRMPRTKLRAMWDNEGFQAHDGGVNSIRVTRDGQILISGGADNSAKIWDLRERKLLKSLEGHTAAVKSVVITPDGTIAYTGGEDQSVRAWDVASGECLVQFEGVGGSVESLDLSPDGKFLLAGGWDMALWDAATGQRLLAYQGHDSDVVSVRWSPDGQLALSGGSDSTVRLWQVMTGKCLKVLEGHTGIVRTLAPTTDGRFALSASTNMWGRPGRLRLWDLASGENLAVLDGHEGSINAVATAFGTSYALSGSSDLSVRLWDLAGPHCELTLKRHGAPITAVAFAPDCRYAASADEDGRLQFWTMDWELDETYDGSWDERMRPIVQNFAFAHQPTAGTINANSDPSPAEVAKALTRRGRPEWTDEEARGLRYDIGCAGFGMPTVENLDRELKKIAQKIGRRTLFG